ncbi:MAG: 4Fe-4S dicluster domain-containing protein [Thermoplasmata archaeon]|nr:4Fe-4S dicluster domain-containing protein [Thermoplasmata archaeon]
MRDGAIVYGDLEGDADLPVGWTDRQEAGRYRLERRGDDALFGYNVGPHSWKKYLFPPHERLWTAHRKEESFEVTIEPNEAPPFAFLGVRACEVAAIEVQDRVFLGKYPDPGYRARRGRSLVIGVACGQAGATCFCTSMGTGPGLSEGYDLGITEILSPGPHRFLVRVGSPRGAELASDLPLTPAVTADHGRGKEIIERTAASMGRSMTTDGLRELMVDNLAHPRWEIVARRCLSCANCTLACPTCFCSTNEEMTALDATSAERWRRWDSCFNLGFTELHSAKVRSSGMSRYRQWLTHKLGTWHDQFGVSGCVGCGRCITWCPVGIDLTEEVAAIREPQGARPPPGGLA